MTTKRASYDLPHASPAGSVAPHDRLNLAYTAFFLQGLAMFLAWNVFFTTAEFMSMRFQGSAFATNYANYLSFSFMAANMVFVSIAMARQHLANFPRQVILAALGNLSIFACLTVLTMIPDISPTTSFWVVVALSAFSGAMCAYAQNACYAITSRWHPSYIQAIASGQGLSGAGTSLAPLAIALMAETSSTADPRAIASRALMTYAICAVVTALALLAFLWVMRTPIYQHYSVGYDADKSDPTPPHRIRGGEILAIARRTFPHCFANVFCWIVSLSLFPAITGNISHVAQGPGAVPSSMQPQAIFTLVHYLVYNSGDWLGRILAGVPSLVLHRAPLVAAISMARVAFIPLFLLCNAEAPVGGATRLLPNLIQSDTAFIVILLLFAVSNGWVSSIAFMTAPERARNAAEEEACGVIQSFMMTFGCTIGSVSSFGVRATVCRCNSFVQ